MKIQDILTNYQAFPVEDLHTIRSSCGTFLQATDSPLIKNLRTTELVSREKVRFHKRKDPFVELFNEALFQKFNTTNIHQRCIFANIPNSSILEDGFTPYYVFPIDGFKFLYSRRVTNVNEELRNTLNELRERFDDEESASKIVHDLLLYTYESSDLEQGIVEGCEIIIYNIPYYFAVNAKAFPLYNQLLTTLRGTSI